MHMRLATKIMEVQNIIKQIFKMAEENPVSTHAHVAQLCSALLVELKESINKTRLCDISSHHKLSTFVENKFYR